MKVDRGVQGILRFCLSNFNGCNVGITDQRDAILMASCGMIYKPSFMKIGIGVQAILRFCFRNLKCCNFGIIGGRDL
jgi:uncharacterized protein YraI